MQDAKLWHLLSRHLAEDESEEEKQMFLKWFNQSEKNKEYFSKVKSVWDHSVTINEMPFRYRVLLAVREKFTFHRIKNFILQKTLGNLVGFVVGMWVTTTFSHTVLERRNLKNLFGIVKRKDIIVNDIPNWLQVVISILVGYIVLELINYFFQTKKYLVLWQYINGPMKFKS